MRPIRSRRYGHCSSFVNKSVADFADFADFAVVVVVVVIRCSQNRVFLSHSLLLLPDFLHDHTPRTDAVDEARRCIRQMVGPRRFP